MIPPEFANFFIASASAGAALVGLLFVAVSIAPEQTVTRQAPMERQVVAGGAFTALMNAFFISMVALIPRFSVGTVVVPVSGLCLVTTLIQVWQLLKLRKGWRSLLRWVFQALLGIVIYGLQLLNGLQFINTPSQSGIAYTLVSSVLSAFALGLIRAWELLGVHRYGLMGWLSPLRNLDETSPHSPPQ